MTACSCCGLWHEIDEMEIALDWNNDEVYMCHRCFNEECDCNEPMYVLESEHLTDEDEDYSPEAFEESDQFFTYGDWLPYAEK